MVGVKSIGEEKEFRVHQATVRLTVQLKGIPWKGSTNKGLHKSEVRVHEGHRGARSSFQRKASM